MKTLLCAAEPWGFGPPSKLFAILRSLRASARVVLAGAGTTLTFAELNPDAVDELVRLDAPRDVIDRVDVEPDAVLSVMDPWAALVGARSGVPTYYVDSLFWFWSWDGIDSAASEREARRWRSLTPARARAEADAATNWHVVVPMAYRWSTRVFVQRARKAEDRLRLYPPDLLQEVGAIIAPTEAGTNGGPPLLSISGVTSHLTPPDVAARYCELVARLFAAAHLDVRSLRVTGNPDFLPILAAEGFAVEPRSLSAMHSALAEAAFVAAPVGLTTAFEAASTRVPLLFLPEQHDGHGPNLDLLGGADPGAYPDLLLRRHFELERSGPVESIARLDSIYRRLLDAGGPQLDALVDQLAAAVELFDDPDGRAAAVSRQEACARGLVGDFDGAAAVASAVDGTLR